MQNYNSFVSGSLLNVGPISIIFYLSFSVSTFNNYPCLKLLNVLTSWLLTWSVCLFDRFSWQKHCWSGERESNLWSFQIKDFYLSVKVWGKGQEHFKGVKVILPFWSVHHTLLEASMCSGVGTSLNFNKHLRCKHRLCFDTFWDWDYLTAEELICHHLVKI